MKATIIPDAIVLLGACVLDGQLVLETTCRDYDHFCVLPNAILFEGKVCGKTGWSSDTYRACYKSDIVAFAPPGYAHRMIAYAHPKAKRNIAQ